jgi:hypothetical protein
MRVGGRRVVGVALGVPLPLLAVGCSSGPSDAAKSFCTEVAHLSAPSGGSVALTQRMIKDGEQSGDARLVAGTRQLALALDRHDVAAAGTAVRRFSRGVCGSA